jgi:hypothetical protein
LIPQAAGIEEMCSDDVLDIIPRRASGYRLRKDGESENWRLANTLYIDPSASRAAASDDVVCLARLHHHST